MKQLYILFSIILLFNTAGIAKNFYVNCKTMWCGILELREQHNSKNQKTQKINFCWLHPFIGSWNRLGVSWSGFAFP